MATSRRHCENDLVLRDGRSAFARTDLLFLLVGLSVALLALCTSQARSREPGKQTACANHLRQLGAALLMFATENEDLFPRRTSPAWPTSLRPFYPNTSVLICPADGEDPKTFGQNGPFPADAAPRSYLLNGWSDYYSLQNSPLFSGSSPGLRDVHSPAATIAFGEKVTSSGHYYMDIFAGDDFTELEERRHQSRSSAADVGTLGGSNYSFVDGSVQFLGFGATNSFCPINLWFLTDEWRAAGCP